MVTSYDWLQAHQFFVCFLCVNKFFMFMQRLEHYCHKYVCIYMYNGFHLVTESKNKIICILFVLFMLYVSKIHRVFCLRIFKIYILFVARCFQQYYHFHIFHTMTKNTTNIYYMRTQIWYITLHHTRT